MADLRSLRRSLGLSLAPVLTFLDEALARLYFTRCVLCRARSLPAFCPSCAGRWRLGHPQCARCGNPQPLASLGCGLCDRKEFTLSHLRSDRWLWGENIEILHHLKFKQFPKALRWLLPLGIEDGFYSPQSTVIPVPMDPYHQWRRGFNLAEKIAKQFAQQKNLKLETRGLEKIRTTKPQSSLNRKERAENLRGCFQWNEKKPAPSKVILVDDVFTTGATLEACAYALKEVGVVEVNAWTLFRTPAPGRKPV